jgi:hypothetical protein
LPTADAEPRDDPLGLSRSSFSGRDPRRCRAARCDALLRQAHAIHGALLRSCDMACLLRGFFFSTECQLEQSVLFIKVWRVARTRIGNRRRVRSPFAWK